MSHFNKKAVLYPFRIRPETKEALIESKLHYSPLDANEYQSYLFKSAQLESENFKRFAAQQRLIKKNFESKATDLVKNFKKQQV
ncbi:MAG: hypothetical protein HUJ42_02520 [Malacoplasma sp.]|nr:hypothetical protein [Malacoplasma sp.]